MKVLDLHFSQHLEQKRPNHNSIGLSCYGDTNMIRPCCLNGQGRCLSVSATPEAVGWDSVRPQPNRNKVGINYNVFNAYS